MSLLQLTLFGSFAASWGGKPLSFRSDKIRALFAFLVVEAPQVHDRSALANLLWSEKTDKDALNNLRVSLSRLNRTLAPIGAATGRSALSITSQTVQLGPFFASEAFRADSVTFDQLTKECQTHPHRSLTHCQACNRRLRQAATIYKGDFLAGLTIVESPVFAEWQRQQQEQRHNQAVNTLKSLAAHFQALGDGKLAEEYLHHLLQLVPWEEEAHRQLIALLAERGKREMALAQYEQCRHILMTELGVLPGAETMALIDKIKMESESGQLATIPTSRGRDVSYFPFAQPATPFIGRTKELRKLKEILLDPAYRLVVLMGPGGVGKTRLALAAADQIASHYAEGICVVQLAGASQMEQPVILPTAVAQALNMELDSRKPVVAQVLAYLRERDVLLLLDNLEHLLSEVDFIRDLLQQTARVTLLITSRERLPLQAAYTFLLSGLTVPPEITTDITKAMTYSSVRLFAERASRQPLAAPLDADSLPDVIQLCQLLQGLPLALELAAAWAGYLSYAELRQAVTDSINALAVNLVDVPARQRDIHATFESSWALLPPTTQYYLSQLVVFRGGFDREAALNVADADLPDLNALVDRSLLRRGEDGRYDWHPLVQQFVSEKLWLFPYHLRSQDLAHFNSKTEQLPQTSAEEEGPRAWDVICQSCRAQNGGGQLVCAHIPTRRGRIKTCWTSTHQRHARYYLTFVANQELALMGWRPQEAAARLQKEWDNIQQAVYWSAAQGNLTTVESCLPGLSEFFLLTGRTEFGLSLLRTMENLVLRRENKRDSRQMLLFLVRLRLQIARLLIAQMKTHETMSVSVKILADTETVDLPADVVAAANWQLGKCLQHQGEYARAQTTLEQALRAAQEAQAAPLEAHIWVDLGLVFAERSILDQAQHCFRRTEEIAREIGHARLICISVANLAVSAMNLADYRQAEELAQQVVAISREIAYPVGEVRGLYSLIAICRHRGNLIEARQFGGEALVGMAVLDRPFEQVLVEQEISLVNDAVGRHYQALAQIKPIVESYRKMGRPWQLINALNDKALILAHMGDYEQAREHCEEAEKLARKIGAIEQMFVDVVAGYIFLGLEEYDAAIDFCQEARATSLKTGNQNTQACALTYLGQAYSARSQWTESEQAFHQAIALRKKTGQNHRIVEAQAGLAWLYQQTGDAAQARAMAQAVWGVLQGDEGNGVENLSRLYLICYRVFQSQDDAAAAERVLQRAHRVVQERAAHIDNERLRRLYLQNVTANRLILVESRRGSPGAFHKPATKNAWRDKRH